MIIQKHTKKDQKTTWNKRQTIASHAFIHKIHKSSIRLMHSTSKKWRRLDEPEVHFHEDSFSFFFLHTIIIKFQLTTLPNFKHIQLQMIKLQKLLV